MNTQPSPRIVGAFLIGFALVGGAYVVANFGKAPATLPVAQTGTQSQVATVRTAIAVSDEDGNGIADWRDEFVSAEPIIVESSTTGYELPDTVTGRLGINFVQSVVRTRGEWTPDSYNDEQIITNTISSLEQETSVSIYYTPDIKLLRNGDDDTIYSYANALATAIIENNQTNLDTELLILQDVVNRNDTERLDELRELAEIYRLTRDAVLEIPVPVQFAKEHLDLINGLHAIHTDIDGMTFAFDDPTYSLLRLRRYEGDILGMVKTLENMYLALEPHADLFTAEDSAVFFVEFSPARNIRI